MYRKESKLILIIFFIAALSHYSFAIEIKDSFSCNDNFPHYSFCNAVGFKKWNESEYKTLNNALTSLKALPRLREFFNQIDKSSFKGIYRLEHIAGWYADHPNRKIYFFRSHDKATLWVDPITKVVGVLDSFFVKINSFPKEEQNRVAMKSLLHELSHVIDISMGNISSTKEFYEIFNWRWNKHRRKYVLDSVLHKQAVKEFFKLIENKQRRTWPWVYRQDQKRGNYYSLPSLYSAVNPQENFAENLTHYYLDTNYESYSSFEQIDFFDRLFL